MKDFYKLLLIGLPILYILGKDKYSKMINRNSIIQLTNYIHKTYGFEPKGKFLIGIRGALPDKEGNIILNNNAVNEWNDCMIACDGYDNFVHIGTLDSGIQNVKNPRNPMGVGRVPRGMFFYKEGSHRGKRAFRASRPLTIERDSNKDGKFNKRHVEKYASEYGFNIHARYTSGLVNNNSHGCLVSYYHWDTPEWKKFYDHFKSEKEFPVFILDEIDIRSI